jgi:phosphoglucosamine mutase
VLVVRDTRVSGEMLEAAVCAGISAAGGQALLGGILPTPAASILVRRFGFQLAVVISASHNPFADNGIKFFSAEGRKLPDEVEAAIEEEVLAWSNRPDARGAQSVGPARGERPVAGRVRPIVGALEDYMRELESRFQPSLDGMRVLLDCANGATFRAAPLLFERLGATVETIACEPDGVNINAGVGSTHMDAIVERLRAGGHAVGFAFDGDGDRVLAVGADAQVVDGDELIAQIAVDLHRRGELAGGVAVTVMTNYGFHQAMKEAGIEVATTDVGDRHVVEELARRDWALGGEQSGHIIDMRLTPSGDGIAAALMTLEALDRGELRSGIVMKRLPQVLRNVRVADRDAIEAVAAVWEAVDAESAKLEGRGRVLVRPSGTEPVVRVMAEAPSQEECEAVVGRLSDVVARELGPT